MKLIECVPNFSEGRDQSVLDALARAITSVDGATLLDVDPGRETHRTVFTFVGAPESVAEAAFQAASVAAERIDMTRHRGAHARIGAMDVCPFVPVGGGATMEDCVELARQVGRRIGDELGIPVYLYESAATRPGRKNLADVRRGEYEGLEAKLRDPEWAPDFGPAVFNARSGASVVGARPFLIAYNVNLNTRDRKLAHDIALDIREAGRAQRSPDGQILRDATGQSIQVPGTLPATRAVGWFIPEFGRAQVSINLVDFEKTAPHQAFEEIRRQANRRGLRVTGSELVGLIPRQALLAAGHYYLRAQGRSAGLPEPLVVQLAVASLGLNDVKPFDPSLRVIEYRLGKREEGLRGLTVTGFADETSSDSTAPGGGSVAALCGALAASLAAMVANITVPSATRDAGDVLSAAAVRAQEIKDRLLRAIDEDTAAFEKIIQANRLPKDTEAEQATRVAATLDASKAATVVPLGVLDLSVEAIRLAADLVDSGLATAVSDVGTGTRVGLAGAEGAYLNVRINLKGIAPADPNWTAATRKKADELLRTAREIAAAAWPRIEARLDG
jgi:glutamate formiminotransferase/formiminotetrahydrofolate cyclodeaminase